MHPGHPVTITLDHHLHNTDHRKLLN